MQFFFLRGEPYNDLAASNDEVVQYRGRIGIDRVSEVFGGVSWLISWPRKKPIKI
jgi:hypothetical protein